MQIIPKTNKKQYILSNQNWEHPLAKEYGFMQDNETLTLEEIEKLTQDLDTVGEDDVHISENTRK